MAITSGFFNSVNQDRLYNADQMSEYYLGIISDGVLANYAGALQVNAGTGLAVNVATGRAFKDSRWFDSDAVEILPLTAAHVTLNRYTAVCVHLDYSARLMELTTIDGTPATTPTKPIISDTETDKYLILAYVYVAAGATTITQANITDNRANTTQCGYVTGVIDQVDTTELFNQWESAYEQYFAEMQGWEQSTKDQFDAWFDALTQELNVNTYVETYEKTVEMTGTQTQIPLDMTNYTYAAEDVINVFINGLRANSSDYTLNTGATPVTITPNAYADGTEIFIQVMKSRIGYSS